MDLSKCFVVRWWIMQALISSNCHATCQNFIMKHTQQLLRSVSDLQASGGQSSEPEALEISNRTVHDITCDVKRTDSPVSTVLPSQPCMRTKPEALADVLGFLCGPMLLHHPRVCSINLQQRDITIVYTISK
jgi:hypothetical protein